MAVVRSFLAAISISVTGCAGAQSDFDGLMDAVESRDACISAIEQDIGGHRRQLAATDIRGFVRELLASLPPTVRDAFAQAAAVAQDEINASTPGTGSGSKRALVERLREVTRQELAYRLYPGIENCGSAAFDIVPNVIYRVQQLDRAPMAEQFESIGLTDSFWIEQALLLMLTMEASEADWRPDWFSEIAAID